MIVKDRERNGSPSAVRSDDDDDADDDDHYSHTLNKLYASIISKTVRDTSKVSVYY